MCLHINLLAEASPWDFVPDLLSPDFRKSWKSSSKEWKKAFHGGGTWSSYLSPRHFVAEARKLGKGNLNLLPETAFFPETPCNTLGCRATSMLFCGDELQEELWPSSWVVLGQYISHWPSDPQRGLPASWIPRNSHNEVDPTATFEGLFSWNL